jgi:hypothetical protein
MTLFKAHRKSYHINYEGQPGICVAAVRCRFGGVADHYPSHAEARLAYERTRKSFTEELEKLSETITVSPLSADTIKEGKIINVPPGEYFVCDPYVALKADQESWNQWVATVEETIGWENEIDDPEKQENIAVGASYNGDPVMALKAYYGDGIHLSVAPPMKVLSETGLVGLVSKKTLKMMNLSEERLALGFMFKTTKPMEMWRDEYGGIHIGDKYLILHNGIFSQEQYDKLETWIEDVTAGASMAMTPERNEYFMKLSRSFKFR